MKKIIVFCEYGVNKRLAENFVQTELAPGAKHLRRGPTYSMYQTPDSIIEIRNANNPMGTRGLYADEIYVPRCSNLSWYDCIYVVRRSDNPANAIKYYNQEDYYHVSNH